MPARAIVLRLAPAVCAFLLVAACGPGGGATSSAPSSAPSASDAAIASGGPSSVASAPNGSEEAPPVWLPEWAADTVVPEAVSGRRALPFCGIEAAPAPQPGIFIDRAVRLCFWDAHLAGREAEFVSIQSTMEGAPIATIYRLAADGTVGVFTDFTQDAFGGGAWTAQVCQGVVEGEGDELLGVTECEDAPLG